MPYHVQGMSLQRAADRFPGIAESNPVLRAPLSERSLIASLKPGESAHVDETQFVSTKDAAGAIVYVVDDDLSVREALRSLIRSVGMRCETFASAAEFLRYQRSEGPSCLVLDVQLPDASGLDLVSELDAAEAPIPIIFITGHGTIPMSVRAMKAGALEFLTKPFREEDLISALRQALERDGGARRERAELAGLRVRLEKLTPREKEVLALVAKGMINKQIAAELGTAEQTIKQHRGRVMKKLGVDSVADLVRLVERVLPRYHGRGDGSAHTMLP